MDYTPINFGISTANPIEGYFQGLKDRASLNLVDAQTKQANAQTDVYTQKSIADNLKAESEAEQQAQKQALMQRLVSPNATINDLKEFSLLNGDNSNALKIYEQKTAEQKTAIIAPANQASSAFYNGNIDLGKEILQEQSDAFKNSGDDYNAGLFSAYINYIDKLGASIPKEQLGHIMSNLIDSQIVQVPNGDKIVGARRGEPEANIKLTQAQIKQTNAQTDKNKAEAVEQRIKNVNAQENADLEKEKIKADIKNLQGQEDDRAYKRNNPELSETANKEIFKYNDNLEQIQASKSNVKKLLDILPKISEQGGIFTDIGNWIKQQVGADNNLEAQALMLQNDMRNDYVLSKKIDSVMTDKDADRILQGFPKTKDTGALKEYFTAFEKALTIKEKLQQDRIDWVSANGGLGNARRGLEINGVYIPVGTSFSAFIKTPKKSYWDY